VKQVILDTSRTEDEGFTMKIDELQLLTADVAAQYEFYVNVLGLPVVSQSDTKLTLQAGHSWLTFDRAPAGWSGFYHFAFNIPENQFSEARKWLSERVTLLRDTGGRETFNFAGWDADAIYFYDPGGNVVEYIARHRLDNRSAEPFDGQGLLSISEIGLPTDDVQQTVQALCDQLSIEVFDGAGSDMFTAVGDEEGLFIVVKQGRIWFPDTGRMAEYQPLTVQVRDGTGQTHVISSELVSVNKLGWPR
jgi:catechol-2,3-dioxygenase